MDNKKRILVTGGAGFIGSHLCERLVLSGAVVYCWDNLFTGELNNISHLFKTDRLKFFEQDIREPFDLEVDEIYHLACPASPVHYSKSPVFTLNTAFLGSLNVLKLAKKYNIPILLASTSEVYGDPLEHPQTEGYFGNVNPIGPRSCYDEGKRVMESLAASFLSEYGVPAKIVRIFNTYGPKMMVADGRVVSNFIVQALSAKPLTVYGSGSQSRSFCYIDDLVDGLLKMMAKPDFSGPVNLGNDREISITELAKIVLDITGSKSILIQKDLPKDDPIKRKPDITLAKRELDWQPKAQLIDGLLVTVDYFRGVLSQSLRTANKE